jgi:hypothetical protein
VASFDVVLDRVSRGRPERSLVLTGLRGVGKTVLLNALRFQASGRLWGTGKIEARPERSLRRPLASALHLALREIAPRHRDPEAVDRMLGVLKAFALREAAGSGGARGSRGAAGSRGPRLRERWQPGIDVPALSGRADSGDLEIDLVELLTDAAGLARDVGTGVAVFIDEMQDVTADDISALCAACHELSQQALPLIVVGAGLPHLPAVLSASKSYSERLFRFARIDRLDRACTDQALTAPAAEEGVSFDPAALAALYAATDGYPYFVQAYGKVVWDSAPRTPVTEGDVALAIPEAEAELAVGFFGSRFDRATPAEREYMQTMAGLAAAGRDAAGRDAAGRDAADVPVATAAIAQALGRKPSSLSPARDALLKKGLVYSAERGSVAFTVPHFGAFLRARGD